MLVSTFAGMKKYAAPIRAAIDCCWPQHPSIYYIADCELFGIKKQLCFFDACWTEILLRGLLTLRKEHSGIKHVFYMLDDHCPLRTCDAEAISAYLEIARRHGLAAISFPTYRWPWDPTELIDHPEHVAILQNVEVDIVEGRRLAVVPRNFFRYFQVQPGWWNLDYLVEACKTALDKGISDPWTFEAMQWEGASQHYVADYNWPTVHHGFMAAGKVNPAAISYMSKSAAAELRAQLIKDSIGINSIALYRMQKWAAKTLRYARWVEGAVTLAIRNHREIFARRR